MKLQEIMDEYPDHEFLKADGFDEAVIGVDVLKDRLVYDVEKMIQILIQDGKMIEEEAVEYIYFNVVNAYVGEKTPIYVKL